MQALKSIKAAVQGAAARTVQLSKVDPRSVDSHSISFASGCKHWALHYAHKLLHCCIRWDKMMCEDGVYWIMMYHAACKDHAQTLDTERVVFSAAGLIVESFLEMMHTA